jgi:outer membrane protein assembly factor BamB
MKAVEVAKVLVLAVTWLFSAAAAWGQDWPQWRGPNRDAKATAFKAPTSWPKELAQKWKVTVGGGDASPALVGDKLYVFTRQGDDEVIRCLDAETGKEIWQDKYVAQPATQPAGGPHAGPRSSPTVADGKVVTLGVRGTLSCFDAATGKLHWRKDDFHAWPRFFTASSPIVVDGLCIAQLGGQKNGALVAYDLSNGNEKWKWAGDSPGYASPVVTSIDGTKLIVALTNSKVIAVNAATGKLEWEAPFPAQQMAYNASTPVVVDSVLIYGGSRRGERAVRFEKQGGGVTAKELWSNPENSVQFNSPVLKNGVLYGLTQGNQFFAIDVKTGKTEWTAPAAPQATGERGGRGGRGSGYGSIVDADTVLLALTPSSTLIAFEPSAGQYKEVARIKIAPTPTYACPVISGNRIFIKDQDSVTLWTIPEGG